jgi:Tol biopolymer transport system component
MKTSVKTSISLGMLPVLLCLPCPALSAQTTTRVSVTAAGAQVTGISEAPDLSHTGRFVGFYSRAKGLVPADQNNRDDVFLVDRYGGTIEQISVDSAGVPGNQNSDFPSVSADGRLVAFRSFSNNLSPADTDQLTDVYVRDRLTGITTLVSSTSAGAHPGPGSSQYPKISASGNFVAFQTNDSLVPEDNGAFLDIYLKNLLSGATSRVSLSHNGGPTGTHSILPSISGDGTRITFESAYDQIALPDTNSKVDVFMCNLSPSFSNTLVSVATNGTQGDGNSGNAQISADGNVVVFESVATNLVAGDTNGNRDIFARHLPSGTTTRVNVSSSGVQANGFSNDPRVSADGRFVTFRSVATNLVAGDTNAKQDIFLHDRVTGQTTLISVSTVGALADNSSTLCAISGDGTYLGFDSGATNLVVGDTNGFSDIFVRSLASCSSGGSISNYGPGLAGTGGLVPMLSAEGCPLPGATISLRIEDVVGGALGGLVMGLGPAAVPFKGGTLHVGTLLLSFNLLLGGAPGSAGKGNLTLPLSIPNDPIFSGLSFYFQAAFQDSAAPQGVSLTRGLLVTVG